MFGDGLKRGVRLVSLVSLASLVASCAVPALYGPYYRPAYQGHAEEARIAPTGKSPAPPNQLWIEPGDRRCRFTLWADADEANLVLSWRVDGLPHRAPCMVSMASNAPLLIQDLDTGREISIQRMRWIDFTGLDAPHLDVRQEVDLGSLIPGFGAVPPSERRYTVSLGFLREFDGPLPERVTIQMPELVVGGRSFRPPELTLERGEQFSGNRHEYVPVSRTRLLPSVALTEFAGHAGAGSSGSGSFRMAFAGTYVWHDEPNVLHLASTFGGYPHVWTENWKKDTTKSTVYGDIHVEVMSGERLRLAADTVTWHQTPGAGEPLTVPAGNWKLTMYTPATLGDSFDRFLDWKGKPWNPTDLMLRRVLAVAPDFLPKRFRVTLPPVIVGGEERHLGPIEFEYKRDGVGLAVWP